MLACLLVLGAAHSFAGTVSLVHRRAPQFVRRDLNGQAVSLRSYRGKVILLNFWATWCAPCQEELPRFAAWQRQHEGLQVIAVSMDDDDAPVRSLARTLGLKYPVVMGDADLGTRYGGILGLPVTFLVARDGTIAARFAGAKEFGKIQRRLQQLLAER